MKPSYQQIYFMQRRELDSTKKNNLKFTITHKARNSASLTGLKTPANFTQFQQDPSHTAAALPSILPSPLPAVSNMTHLTSSLQKTNFQHHCNGTCMCEICQCGRHMCKFNVSSPQLSKKSSYSLNYGKKQAERHIALRAEDTAVLQAQNLIKNSTYLKDFKEMNPERSQIERGCDSLKFEGPSQTRTTYANQFYGRAGVNQYVKPTTERNIVVEAAFTGKSTYAKEFNQKAMERHKSLRHMDSLKTGQVWMGQSTYNSKFRSPVKRDYAKGGQMQIQSQRISSKIDDIMRFKTSYNGEFIKKENKLCPVLHSGSSTHTCCHMHHFLDNNGDVRGTHPDLKTIAHSRNIYS